MSVVFPAPLYRYCHSPANDSLARQVPAGNPERLQKTSLVSICASLGPGSDRSAEKWKDDIEVRGCESLKLHHLYRAMAWLGEKLPEDQQV